MLQNTCMCINRCNGSYVKREALLYKIILHRTTFQILNVLFTDPNSWQTVQKKENTSMYVVRYKEKTANGIILKIITENNKDKIIRCIYGQELPVLGKQLFNEDLLALGLGPEGRRVSS